jgi:N-acetylglutamate synthase-like GNAT family acetyltransferase
MLMDVNRDSINASCINPPMNWMPRLALEKDIPTLEELIPLSVRALQTPYYSPAQMEMAIGPVFNVDHRLILDGTYFVVEGAGKIVGCGGWSKRKKLSGCDGEQTGLDELLDPKQDAARIRAFFVHPEWARRGIGLWILKACERAAMEAGFQKAELVATLAGEPLYASYGYAVLRRYESPMSGGVSLPVVHMAKSFKMA